MKVLFVCSGNDPNFEVSPIIKNQADSLRDVGVEVDYFLIKGKGLTGYLSNIPKLRKFLKDKSYDLIHTHYSFSDWIAILGSRGRKVVLSLMGSDTLGNIEGESSGGFINKVVRWQAKIIQLFCS